MASINMKIMKIISGSENNGESCNGVMWPIWRKAVAWRHLAAAINNG
jgi:hypothetical protein